MVIGYLNKYAGEDCKDLKMAILLDVDIFDLYCDNAEDEGIITIENARSMVKPFNGAKKYITTANVMKWLEEDEKMELFVSTIRYTSGGLQWFDKQITKFREGLFGP